MGRLPAPVRGRGVHLGTVRFLRQRHDTHSVFGSSRPGSRRSITTRSGGSASGGLTHRRRIGIAVRRSRLSSRPRPRSDQPIPGFGTWWLGSRGEHRPARSVLDPVHIRARRLRAGCPMVHVAPDQLAAACVGLGASRVGPRVSIRRRLDPRPWLGRTGRAVGVPRDDRIRGHGHGSAR